MAAQDLLKIKLLSGEEFTYPRHPAYNGEEEYIHHFGRLVDRLPRNSKYKCGTSAWCIMTMVMNQDDLIEEERQSTYDIIEVKT